MKTGLRYIAAILIHLFLVLHTAIALSQALVINEIMASNATTIPDEDGDFEDWIEIYNADAQAVNLLGYGLSDNSGNPFKWVFPEVSIQAGEFLLVWASGKNRSNPGNPLHTNFAISAAGEEVLITHPSGDLIDELPPLPLPTDISYGRQPDGGNQWYYFTEATPGFSNTSQGWSEILNPPDFSHTAGVYSQSFELTISHPDPDVSVFYTLDGSVPRPENTSGVSYRYKNVYPEEPGDPFGEFYEAEYISHLYQQPIGIDDRSGLPDAFTHINTTWLKDPFQFPENPVLKGTVVRAKAVKEGALSSPVATASYFLPEDGLPFTLNVVSLSCDPDVLFDYDNGIYVAGKTFDNWRLQNPDEIAIWPDANFFRRGEWYEHPMHFELFNPDGEPLFEQAIGMRIHGGWSRRLAVKSFRLIARTKYSKNSLDYPFFSARPFNSYNQLILRNAGQDWPGALMRDAVFHSLVKHLNFTTQAYEPNVVFINGEYWGIQNFRERTDEQFLERLFGVDPEQVDLLESNAMVIAGDTIHYKQMYSFVAENDMSLDENYAHLLTLMDVESFIDYFAAEIYSANDDWPGNNIRYWRKRTEDYMPHTPEGHDGRWRWILFDTDGGFGHYPNNYTFNTLAVATADDGPGWPNPPWSTLLFRQLLTNDSFKNAFINRTADLLNTAFMPWQIEETVTVFKNRIEPEIEMHIARWNRPYSYNWWEYSVNNMLVFAENRPQYLSQHIIDHFELQGQTTISLDVSNHQHGHIRINTVDIVPSTPGVHQNPYPWEGSYFVGIPVTITAIPEPGYEFSHWENLPDTAPAEVTITPVEALELKAHFVAADEPELLYFWMFDNSVPNDTPLEELAPVYQVPGNGNLTYHSALHGYPFYQGHPLWRKASMERRNAPTPINYHPAGNDGIPYDQSNMRGLQVKQPFTGDAGENTMYFHMPATHYSNLVFEFAAINEGAASHLIVDYSTDQNDDLWTNSGLEQSSLPLSSVYQLFTIDFSGIADAANNPHFKVRLRFAGPNMAADDGNRVTFNNFSLEGTVLVNLGENKVPTVAQLEQNHPNPFRHNTNIRFRLEKPGKASLQVFNSLGTHIATAIEEFLPAGTHTVLFENPGLPPGLYFYQLKHNNQVQTKRMVIIK